MAYWRRFYTDLEDHSEVVCYSAIDLVSTKDLKKDLLAEPPSPSPSPQLSSPSPSPSPAKMDLSPDSSTTSLSASLADMTEIKSLPDECIQEAQLSLRLGQPYWLSLTLKVIQGQYKKCMKYKTLTRELD